VKLQQTETMSLANLSEIVDDAKIQVDQDKPKAEVLKTLEEAMSVIQFFLKQNTTPDTDLPEPPAKGQL
jgi:hypothetical protein